MNLVLSCLQIGLCFGLTAIAVYISFKILDTPDLTIDGSFTLGGAVSAVFVLLDKPILGIILGILSGALAGIVTGVLHTKLKIQAVLSGILTMTALYSINFWVTSRKPSILLYNNKTLFKFLNEFKSTKLLGTNLEEVFTLLLLIIIIGAVIFLLDKFFKTNLGMAIRATGDNEVMVRSSSINTDVCKIIALALANGLVALSGSLYVNLQANYDNSYGVGMMVIGLASIIIGEAIFRKRKLGTAFIISLIGAIIYQIIFMVALLIDGIDPIDIKVITALIIVLSVCKPLITKKLMKGKKQYVKS